ncbi:MAG: hypothetical protein JNN08_03100 [Bryobacterales bacterium]|nr:hypothetical protein [Bryobacterales bacterium]
MGTDPNSHSEILGQVRRIEASRRFANAPKAKFFLNHIVSKTLAGQEAELKEILIAQALYGKGTDFDPGNDRVVSQAAGDLRKRLIEYYADEGRDDRLIVEIPVGSFVPKFTVRSGPEHASAQPVTAQKAAAKKAWALAAAAAIALIVVGVLYAQLSVSGVRITSPADGATVGPVQDISGKGWDPAMKNYLVVEPIDQSGRRWVQAQIASAEWTRVAHFGQADTPSGMKYRIYILSTKTELPIGEITKQPESPRESPVVTVTLRK